MTIYTLTWLVVSTPLKNMSSSIPYMWKRKSSKPPTDVTEIFNKGDGLLLCLLEFHENVLFFRNRSGMDRFRHAPWKSSQKHRAATMAEAETMAAAAARINGCRSASFSWCSVQLVRRPQLPKVGSNELLGYSYGNSGRTRI